MRLSIVTATRGRLHLRNTLANVKAQLRKGDEHIVIGDGPQWSARQLCQEYGVTYAQGPVSADWGNTQRDVGIRMATGDYVLFMDDDDVYTPGALDAVRSVLASQAHWQPVMFRMVTPGFGVIWREPVVMVGNVGTPMFVAPNDDRLASWLGSPEPYCGDHWFIENTIANHGGAVVWREEVICQCRMQQQTSTC